MARTPSRPRRTQAEAKQPRNASGNPASLAMGRLGAAHGLAGWLRVVSYADPPEQLQNYRDWTLVVNGDRRQATLSKLRSTPNGLLCLLERVDTRDAAEELNGAEIRIDRAALPPAGEGQWYWADLEGLEVCNLDNEHLGGVTGLMATGANDVLIVEGDRRRLIPFSPGSFVREVNIAEGRLVVDWNPED